MRLPVDTRRPKAPNRSLLGFDAMAEWLESTVFVRRLVAERRIPFVKIGKFVRFDPAEVSAWIDGQRVKPVHRSSGIRSRNRG